MNTEQQMHARQEKDFGQEDPSYFFWEALSPTQDDAYQTDSVPLDRTTKQDPSRCDECDQPATWVRRTQFAGNHYFCPTHAAQQEDFRQEDDSNFFWEELPFSLFCEEAVDTQ